MHPTKKNLFNLQLPFRTIDWSTDRNAVSVLDQRRLPGEEVYIDLVTVDEICSAIRSLAVRGAPAIGVAAAMGLAVAYRHAVTTQGFEAGLLLARDLATAIAASRPTAVNLQWALNRMLASVEGADNDSLPALFIGESELIRSEDETMCRMIGEFGADYIKDGATVLTHCNAGALATAGIGTALAPLYVARAQGRSFSVFADETRPLLQGSRLTAWELSRAGIPVTVLPDSAAASLLRSGRIDVVLVGADRIAANGDFANKIGTYPLALAAREHGVPLVVCAPWSTMDLATKEGAGIVVENRGREELDYTGDRYVLPPKAHVFNPAFDVTPRHLVSAYVSDRGIVSPPFKD